MWLKPQFRSLIAAAMLGASIIARPAFASPQNPPPAVQAEAAVVMDVATGRVLFAMNAGGTLPPASTLKILTALIALERAPLDAIVPITERAQNTEGSSMYLRAGSRWPLRHLLYGLLLASGNDAAVAIAEHLSGSVEGFTEIMNQRAREIGATHSHFVNPNGLPAPGQFTTAHDLALITRTALHNPAFREIIATREVTFTTPEGEQRTLSNNNRLLGLEGIDGVKTGYTAEAGHTYVASATRRDWELIVTLMRDSKQGKWDDARALLDWAYASYRPVPLFPPAVIGRDGLRIPVRSDGSESVYYEIFIPEKVLTIYLNSRPSWRLPLMAQEEVGPAEPRERKPITAEGKDKDQSTAGLWESLLRTFKTFVGVLRG